MKCRDCANDERCCKDSFKNKYCRAEKTNKRKSAVFRSLYCTKMLLFSFRLFFDVQQKKFKLYRHCVNWTKINWHCAKEAINRHLNVI